jgi:putative ATPase
MPNDERDQTLFKIEEPSKPRKSSKSSKSVGEIAPKVEVKASKNQPLADRMRPRNLDEFAGQAHILGPGKLLRRAIEADCIQSLIFYGPPGTGKTTLAQIIANETESEFEQLSGVESNVKDMRRVLAAAAVRLENKGASTILFIDEIHRFNKAQQDVLLPGVESGGIKLIGATTHNPYFFVNSPLVSRSQIFELQPLTEADLLALLQRALKDEERGLGKMKIAADEAALSHLAKISDGDARKALNSLEIAAITTAPDADGTIRITLAVAEQSIQQKAVVYEDGDHFDAASAYQKAMRGSDADASLYWLAKMIVAGEDPRFIARRLVVCASEDVGLADPTALMLATAALRAAEFLGLEESKHALAQATIYIATAPKSNSACVSITAAIKDVKTNRTIPFPKKLRDQHSPGVTKPGSDSDYEYAHDHPDHFVAQDYLGVDKTFYKPTEQGAEKLVMERVENWRKQFQEVRRQSSEPVAIKNILPPETCSVCHHAHPFNGSFMCVNATVLEKNPNPGTVYTVKPDHRCDSFKAARAR